MSTEDVGSHRTCAFLTILSLGCVPSLNPQLGGLLPHRNSEDFDKIVRIRESQDGEKPHVAVHKYGENLQKSSLVGWRCR